MSLSRGFSNYTNIIITGKKCPTSTTQSVLWHANLALYVGVLSELDWYLYVCIAANKKFFFRDISYLSQILEASEIKVKRQYFLMRHVIDRLNKSGRSMPSGNLDNLSFSKMRLYSNSVRAGKQDISVAVHNAT